MLATPGRARAGGPPLTAARPNSDERVRLLEVLRRALESIGVARDEREVFETVVRESARQLRYGWVSVVLGEPDERSPRMLLSEPPGRGALRVGEVVRPPSGFWQAMQTGDAFVRESLDAGGPLWEDGALRDLRIAAYVAIPLRLRGKVIGTFNVGTLDPVGIRQKVAMLTELAEFTANAFLAARLIAEVQHGMTRLRERASLPPPPDLHT